MSVRIAMWSGPRNISTAMMRSFGARGDTVVVDEPLYAYYLRATGLDHPGREEILASQPQDWHTATTALRGPLPSNARIQYQKQMAHHILPEVDTGWMVRLRHAFLIRDPARVISSYARVRAAPTLADLGFPSQAQIFRQFGGPVVDADDLLRDPAGMLTALCEALEIDYQPTMLKWPPGRRATDGVWAPYWYRSVEESTGFAEPFQRGAHQRVSERQPAPRYPTASPEIAARADRARADRARAALGPVGESSSEVPQQLQTVLKQAMPYYLELASQRLRPQAG